MSKVTVTFGGVAPSPAGRQTPVINYKATSQTITSSGTSQAYTISALDEDIKNVCVITNDGDESVWINFDADAAVDTGHKVLADTQYSIAGMPKGSVPHVINDS